MYRYRLVAESVDGKLVKKFALFDGRGNAAKEIDRLWNTGKWPQGCTPVIINLDDGWRGVYKAPGSNAFNRYETRNENAYQRAINAASYDGDRVILNGKTIWAGLGNRSGLHSYLPIAIANKWKQSAETFLFKLFYAEAGSGIDIQMFRNQTRDRGFWGSICRLSILNEVNPVKPEMITVEKFRAALPGNWSDVLRAVVAAEIGEAIEPDYTHDMYPFRTKAIETLDSLVAEGKAVRRCYPAEDDVYWPAK